MKKLNFRILILLSVILASGMQLSAQVPDMFNYQAVIRDQSTGDPLQNTNVSLRIAILSSISPDIVLWEEEHVGTSNEFGLINLKIGDPAATAIGGSAASFSSIDWSGSSYFLRLSVMPSGGSWQIMPATRLISVPFSLLAKDTQTKQQLSKSGDFIILSDGGSVDLSAYMNPDQSLSLTGNILSLSNGGSVDLSSYIVNNQSLTLDGSLLSLSDGGTVDLGVFVDPPQSISLSGNILALSDGGGSADLSGFVDPNQIISKVDNTVSLSGGGGSFSLGEYVNQFEVNEDALFRLDGSLVLGSSEASGSKLAVVSEDDASEEALFEVKRADGQTVFAVYPEAVRVYVAKGDPAVKAPGGRGGFAIAGFDRDKATPINDLLWLTPDSVRFYIDDTQTGGKGSRGGFAIAGFDRDKGESSDYLTVSGNTVMPVVDSSSQILFYPLKDALLAGTIHIGSPDSVGQNSVSLGFMNTAMGQYSQSLGYKSFARGDYGSAIGKNATSLQIGDMAFGTAALADGQYSYAIGNRAEASGYKTYAFGYLARATGTKSYAVGSQCISSGEVSFAFGHATNASGNSAMAMGRGSAADGYHAIAIGVSDDTSPRTTASGSKSIAIGSSTQTIAPNSYALGYWLLNNDDNSVILGSYNDPDIINTKLVIGNGTGDFNRHNAMMVFDDGNVTIQGSLTQDSDVRLKENIKQLEYVSNDLMALNPVYYEFRDKQLYSSDRQLGLIAQDIEPFFPELVRVNSKGIMSLDYSRLSVVLIKAFQEQYSEIEDKNKRIIDLENENADIRARLEALEAAVISMLENQ